MTKKKEEIEEVEEVEVKAVKVSKEEHKNSDQLEMEAYLAKQN